MTLSFRCVQCHTVKRDVRDAKGVVVTTTRKAGRSDGSFIEVQEPVQEKAAEKVYLYLAADEAKRDADPDRARDTRNFLALYLADPAEWEHFIEGQTYAVEFQ